MSARRMLDTGAHEMMPLLVDYYIVKYKYVRTLPLSTSVSLPGQVTEIAVEEEHLVDARSCFTGSGRN